MRVVKDKYWWQARRREEKDFAEVQEKVNKPLFDEGGNALKFGEEESGLQLQVAEDDKMVASNGVSVADSAVVANNSVAEATLPVAKGIVQVADVSKLVALAVEFAKEKLQSSGNELQNRTGCKDSSELHSKPSEVAELKTELQNHKDLVASLKDSVEKLEADAYSKDKQVVALEEKVSKVLDLPNKNELLSELNEKTQVVKAQHEALDAAKAQINSQNVKIETLEQGLNRALASNSQVDESEAREYRDRLNKIQEFVLTFQGEIKTRDDRIRELEDKLAQSVKEPSAQGTTTNQKQKAGGNNNALQNVSAFSSKEKLTKNSPARKPLSTFVLSAGIILFIIFNTYFLVSEQYSLNVSLGYSVAMAWLIAALTEAGLVLLSMAGSWASTFSWKMCLYGTCAVMTWVTVGIIDSSVDNRVEHSAATSDKINRLRDRLTSLQAQEHTAQAVIDQLDPEVYPTRIERLTSKLEAGPSAKIEAINAELDQLTSSHSSAKSDPLIQQRRVMLLCNLLLAGFLGFLWAGRNNCWIKDTCNAIKCYFSNFCETQESKL